jgi:type IV secretion system protein VirB2
MNATTGSAARDSRPTHARRGGLLMGLALLVASHLALAQAQGSPFMTGATSLQTNILAWLTPIAVIFVMILGIAIAFGAPQIVTWVRGMFAV